MAVPEPKHSDILAGPRSPAKFNDAPGKLADNKVGNQSKPCVTCRENDRMAETGAMTRWARPQSRLDENAAADGPHGDVDNFTEVSTRTECMTVDYEDRYPIIALHWGITS